MNNEDIVKLLIETNGILSGSDIANTLGVTRAAVWKKIKLLNKKGYQIEAIPARGYRLIKSPDLSIEEMKHAMSETSTIGKEILFFETIDSTNLLAIRLCEKDYPEGTVIIAEHQTNGKGRLGRKWLSPPRKNLYMSIILRPNIYPKDAAILTLLTSVACTTAIRKMTNTRVSIKWPNDLMIGNKKLGGILTEIKADMDRVSYAVVGIGLNINLDSMDFPKEIREIATSIKKESGQQMKRTEIAVSVLKELDSWYSTLMREGKKTIIEEWLRLSSTIGMDVRVTSGNTILEGIAVGINEEGMLMIRLPDNSLKRICAGDVQHLRMIRKDDNYKQSSLH